VAEVWVVNASPLIVLDRLGQLDLFAHLGNKLVVPGGVLVEISRGPRPINPNRLDFFRTVTVDAIDPIVAAWDLGRGESEVLTCAASEHADVAVLDDRSARRCAMAMGLATHGTLHVLLQAKKAGLFPAVAPMIDRARAEGLFLSDALVARVLLLAGEKP
jgi:predicted nucleic acid-binding protein